MPETTVLRVLLHCDGCVSKVKRHIRRLDGVESFHVDQKNSKVTVYGTVNPQAVLEKVLRAGKTAEFWSQPAEETAKAEVPAAKSKEESAQIVPEEVGKKKKKKASDSADIKATKKQKAELADEIKQEDVGDGEIVDGTILPVQEADDESDERVLIKNKKPRKKGIFRTG